VALALKECPTRLFLQLPTARAVSVQPESSPPKLAHALVGGWHAMVRSSSPQHPLPQTIEFALLSTRAFPPLTTPLPTTLRQRTSNVPLYSHATPRSTRRERLPSFLTENVLPHVFVRLTSIKPEHLQLPAIENVLTYVCARLTSIKPEHLQLPAIENVLTYVCARLTSIKPEHLQLPAIANVVGGLFDFCISA
jgi:hypothetical protein